MTIKDRQREFLMKINWKIVWDTIAGSLPLNAELNLLQMLYFQIAFPVYMILSLALFIGIPGYLFVCLVNALSK